MLRSFKRNVMKVLFIGEHRHFKKMRKNIQGTLLAKRLKSLYGCFMLKFLETLTVHATSASAKCSVVLPNEPLPFTSLVTLLYSVYV